MLVSPKLFATGVIAALFIPAIFTLAFNLYTDPFQIYHKDIRSPTVLLGGRGADRYQQAGIINQYDISSMIIGNSHSANYLPSKLRDTLGWEDAYTLTMDGATINEQSTVAKYALQNKQADQILWGVSGPGFMRPWNARNRKLPLKMYLYDENRFNDIVFFLNFDLYKYWRKKSVQKRSASAKTNPILFEQQQFDTATSWYAKRKCRFNKPVFVASKILNTLKTAYFDIAQDQSYRFPVSTLGTAKIEESKSFNNYKETFSKNIKPLIIQNNSSQFNFVLTAFPTLRMQQMKANSPLKYRIYLRIIRQFVIDTQSLGNVSIYAFGTEPFTNDLRLYKDPGHYHIEVNNYIIDQISQGKNKLDIGNIDAYIRAFDEKISMYELPDIWNPTMRKISTKKGYLSKRTARRLINAPASYQNRDISSKKELSIDGTTCEK